MTRRQHNTNSKGRKQIFHRLHKPFEKVRLKNILELFELLGNLDLFGKDIRTIHKIYWRNPFEYEQKDTNIEWDVIQRCLFSPQLFNLYSAMIVLELEIVVLELEMVVLDLEVLVRFIKDTQMTAC